MTEPLVVTCNFSFRPHRRRGAQESAGANATANQAPSSPGRVPRVARLLALAIKFEALLHQGVITDYAALARLGRVSRARISQIMDLLLLAPDIQEEILFLPAVQRGRDQICLRSLHGISMVQSWQKQRILWHKLNTSVSGFSKGGGPSR